MLVKEHWHELGQGGVKKLEKTSAISGLWETELKLREGRQSIVVQKLANSTATASL